MSSGGGMGTDDDRAVSFAHALATLKEQGSALLVVGTVPEEMYDSASTQMLGDPDADDPRRRLVVTTRSERQSAHDKLRSTGPLTPDFARLVTRNSPARSAAATTASGTKTLPKTDVVEGSVADLGTTISNVLEEFDLFADGLDPAELRVAFDCLSTLLTEYDRETVFRFVHVLTTQIRRIGGLAHFRLPRDPSSELVRLFSPLFDATIHLRLDGTQLKQQWHFRDRDLVSDWLPLERREESTGT
ncbi:hypothetical protein ACFQJD_06715 [Haloplanus sp. GCM10025708]|uniref:DUF7504 family protein n=1 Tax=Haloferacaceae TaxID=1644056 RepID=UPI00362315B9